MCDTTDHAGCELAQLQVDYPSWVIVDHHLPPDDRGPALDMAEAKRGGRTLSATGADRLERLRHELVRVEAGEL